MNVKTILLTIVLTTSLVGFNYAQEEPPSAPKLDIDDPPLLPAGSDVADPPVADPKSVPKSDLTRGLPDATTNPPPTAIQPAEIESLDKVAQSMLASQAGIAEAEHPPELVLDTGAVMGEVGDLSFSPDGRLLAVSGDKVVRIFATETGKLQHTLRGDRSRTSYGNCNGVAFSPDGNYLVVGVNDYHPRGSIRLYRTDNLDEIDQLLPGHSAPTSFVTFSRDGRFMATNDVDGEIILWDWPSKKILKKIPPRNPDAPIVDVMRFADREPYLLTIEHDGPHVYRVPDGTKLSVSDPMPAEILGWMFDILTKKVQWPFNAAKEPRTLDFRLEHGVWAAASVGKEGGGNKFWVGLWKARPMDQNAPPSVPYTVYTKHRWDVYAIALSSAGDLVASGDKFGEVHLWDARTGQQKQVIKSPGAAVYETAFDGTTDRIAYGTRPDLKGWSLNHYGLPSKIIDLKQRVIRNVHTTDNLKSIAESTELGGTRISILKPSAGNQSYQIAKQQPGQAATSYRIPSGRIPSVCTLLSEPKLDVQQPVLFGDNFGLLAMWNSAGDEMQRFYRGHESMVTSISPASNGKVFVTGSTDRTIRIWSLLNHKRTGIPDFKYENTAIIQVPPNSSSAKKGVQIGDRIVSVDGMTLKDMYEKMMAGKFAYQPGQVVPVVVRRGEQRISYAMTMEEGYDFVEPLLNVFVGENDQWIIWSPQGYYDCSPGADRWIVWHVNRGPERSAKFYRAEQFKRQLYRPDIINRILETGDTAEAVKIANTAEPARTRGLDLKPLDLTQTANMADSAPPLVRIQSPSSETRVTDPRVTVAATVLSTNRQPITEVTLLHNGTPAKVFKPRDANQRQQMNISHRLKLFPGRNTISFIAANPIATSTAEEATLAIRAPAGEARPRAFVLAIGISQYANDGQGIHNLKYPTIDAEAFVQAVKQHHQGQLYSQVNTRLLLDNEATRNQILSGLQWLVENVQPGDAVMLFAACHGFMQRDNFYLATHEVDKDNLRATGISWREITGLLHEELPACRRIVFLDACHSQGIAGPDTRSPLHDLSSPELGTIFYASSTLQQQSFESEQWRHGAFTKAILDTLADSEADFSPRSGDGLINTVELQSGVSEKVKVMTGDRQHPVAFLPYTGDPFNVLELLAN